MRRVWTLIALLIVPAVWVAGGCETMFDDGAGTTPGLGDFVTTGQTASFFTAVQVDPRSEDSAGPQLVDAADLDGDGLMDLASIWNESQPLQVHLQRRDADGALYFLTLPIGGTTPIARASGLKIADMDVDGRPDLVVLIKDTGLVALCDPERDDCDVTDNGGVVSGAIDGGLVIFYNPPDPIADVWEPTTLLNSFRAGTDGELPEEGGYTDLDIGDFDGRFGPDLVVAFNSAEGDPQVHRIDIYVNPGGEASRNDGSWERTTVFEDLPTAKSVAVLDVDRDGDYDIVGTFPDSKSAMVFWLPNPFNRDGADAVANPEAWDLFAPIGQIATGADTLAIGDVDNDGISDVMVRSSGGRVVQWFKGPQVPSTTFIRNPWQVYTLAQFTERQPQGMAVGDLTGDGQVEAVIAAEGAVVWFDSLAAPSVYDHWGENLIVDEGPPDVVVVDTAAVSEPATDPAADAAGVTQETQQPAAQELETTGTLVNALLIVDVDGDGFNDIVGTIDRKELSGLTNDALIWFRNNRR
ncbi:MAG TPA: VCBS repeat-containing protein [Phycisphaerae bacterium]|nr:VCBS repeat-containing protein [Phycisphaerae bacterium]